jgi:hypothetical protein
VLKEKPLRMLENLDRKFPPFISFHMRELYLRKNLPFEVSKGNLYTFKAINDEFLHEYLTFLMCSRIKPEVISVYMQTLEESQQVNFMKGLLEYCERTLRMNPDQICTFATELETANPLLDEILDHVRRRQAESKIEVGDIKGGFKIALEMDKPDYIIQVGYEFRERLADKNMREEVIAILKRLD